MRVVVFCGPTVSSRDVNKVLDADIRPPAARGDVLEAAMSRPDAIGLVDGMFDSVPAVWHKEILWAMREGIHVFGAASMGALRAAELDSFGMVGVGAIYEAFRSGALEDDDEVAVAHAMEEHAYRALSEPMVNIRATLRAAEAARVISAEQRAELEVVAKTRPYPERAYGMLLQPRAGSSLAAPALERFKAWLPQGRVDQKRLDAFEMFGKLATLQRDGWVPKRVDYVFSHTHAWQSLERRVAAGARRPAIGAKEFDAPSDVLEEALLTEDARAIFDGALARSACLDLARRLDLEAGTSSFDAFVEEFRRQRGLLSAEEFDDWLETQGLSDESARVFFQHEYVVSKIALMHDHDRLASAMDHLRATGRYGVLASRARKKRAWLSARGLELPNLRDARLSESQLWQWHFIKRLNRSVPADVDAYARAQGVPLETLRSVLIREFIFTDGTHDT